MQIEKYIADKITSICEKRDISKDRLSQLSGIFQSSLREHDAGNSNVNAAWTLEVGEQFEYMYRLFFFIFQR